MLKRLLALVLLLFACRSAKPPAGQNPSPMVEHTRAHERISQRPLAGSRYAIEGMLTKPIEVLVTPAAAAAGHGDLVIHFHGAAWLPMQSAEETGRPLVVAVVNLGAGSGRYATPFHDGALLGRIIDAVRAKGPRIDHVYATGFSAGYGAIREILAQTPEVLDGVLLLDGLHTSYIPEGKPLAEGGKIDEEKLKVFVAFARRAIAGEKRFVITHSEIFPGTFASTTETTDWLLKSVGVERKPVVQWGPRGMQQLSEAHSGSFRVLGFAGNTAPDHIDHLHGYREFLDMLFVGPQAGLGRLPLGYARAEIWRGR